MFLYVIEWVLIILGIAFIFTQIIIPLVRNLPLFPSFRSEQKLAERLVEAEEQVRILQGEKRVARTLHRAGIGEAPRPGAPAAVPETTSPPASGEQSGS